MWTEFWHGLLIGGGVGAVVVVLLVIIAFSGWIDSGSH